MRAIVIGGSGQIGGWLLRHLADRGHEAVGTFATVPYPGLIRFGEAEAAPASTWIRSYQPDVIFYPAGFTWVDGCERDPARARSANVERPAMLARAASSLGCRFVYYSTDYLFDGANGPYAEDATPHPLNVYGRTKLEAERTLTDILGKRLLIARTCWVYGPERQGKNFAYQVMKTLSRGKPLTCPTDQVANPSYGPDVALATLRLVEMGVSGVIHVAGPEWLSRVRLARTIAEGFGHDPSLIVGKPTSATSQATPRPLLGGLRSDRLEELLPGSMRPMSQALNDFRRRLNTNEGWADPREAA